MAHRKDNVLQTWCVCVCCLCVSFYTHSGNFQRRKQPVAEGVKCCGVSLPALQFLCVIHSFFLKFLHAACQRHHPAVQPAAGGLRKCQDSEEQQLQQICKVYLTLNVPLLVNQNDSDHHNKITKVSFQTFPASFLHPSRVLKPKNRKKPSNLPCSSSIVLLTKKDFTPLRHVAVGRFLWHTFGSEQRLFLKTQISLQLCAFSLQALSLTCVPVNQN